MNGGSRNCSTIFGRFVCWVTGHGETMRGAVGKLFDAFVVVNDIVGGGFAKDVVVGDGEGCCGGR